MGVDAKIAPGIQPPLIGSAAQAPFDWSLFAKDTSAKEKEEKHATRGSTSKPGPPISLGMSEAAICGRYEKEGFVSPLRALNAREVGDALAGFKRFQDEHCQLLDQRSPTIMNHAWLPWMRDLAKHPAILKAVSAVLATKNIFLYNSQLLAREPGHSQMTSMGVGWHKDADPYYSRLSPVDRRHWVTAFVALSKCHRENGCLLVKKTDRGGWVEPDAGEEALELYPGEFSLHGPSTTHTGGLNTSDETRYAVALRFIRASTRDLHAEVLGREAALLVSGVDKHKNFDLMPEVEGEATEEGRLLRDGILHDRRMGPSSYCKDGMVCA
mmetsp:Transcript_28031/g.63473  ORF Transcript_28031/g.63473 Transcript_28031/m.63473 type:complete len:326 (+) Transcript_28031:90-1067(+)|eukprot:CAMPEP_0197915508 /NCGR_PEP_ID=MMETSP1439-20131203/80318_1 /TAXON_ID=66791 /ORGANISM="Gonyaulax spinifera, Strain CCMP409" /LENGTH=325 /DNA_ID=CAMNT_0043537467 /DNA_START=86 /DNA_END=1063 /DNA_ORIENTATION=-